MVRLSVSALLLSAAVASDDCSDSFSLDSECYWPYQKQYSNFSVADQADTDAKKAACCAACSADLKCMQWTLMAGDGAAKSKKDVCILNNALINGDAPQDKSFGCHSGKASACRAGCPSNPAPPAVAPKGAKNVLFFAVDDLRPEIDIFGGVPGTPSPKMHTPNLKALAEKSLVLTKNYVQQAVCSPTRQSILTGRRPDRTRVYDLYVFFRDVAANYTTIPEFFRLAGYNTSGGGKIFHPGHASGGDNDLCCSWSHDTSYFLPKSELDTKDQSWMAVDKETEALYPLDDNLTADNAVQVLDTLKASRAAGDDRPFFMAVGFHKPHLPFVASQEFFDLYPMDSVSLPYNQQPPEGMPKVAWSAYGELRNYADQASLNATGQPGTVLPEQDVLQLRRAYYAAVSQTDAMIGKVLAALEHTGESDNTVISFWGDHGWQLGEHGEWCKHTNFEFATRAPMMVHVPGLTDQGIITEHYSEHVDLFPTLTEAAMGVQLENCPSGDASFDVALCAEGSSLVPLMRNPSSPVKTASFSQYPRGYQKDQFSEEEEGELGSNPTMSKCITEGGKGCTMGYTLVTNVGGHEYRYTEWADFNTKGFKKKVNWDRNVGIELYNHSADPGENINLDVTSHKSLASKLAQMLREGPDAARVPAAAFV